jgi:hypothetical protein
MAGRVLKRAAWFDGLGDPLDWGQFYRAFASRVEQHAAGDFD